MDSCRLFIRGVLHAVAVSMAAAGPVRIVCLIVAFRRFIARCQGLMAAYLLSVHAGLCIVLI